MYGEDYMGKIINCRCPNKDCRYEFRARLGTSRYYPAPAYYYHTIGLMERGMYGDAGQEFLAKSPNGAISLDKILIQCAECGKYSEVAELTMYEPLPGAILEKDIMSDIFSPLKSRRYVDNFDLKHSYTAVAKYPHICPLCKQSATVVENAEKKAAGGDLICPSCKSTLDVEVQAWE